MEYFWIVLIIGNILCYLGSCDLSQQIGSNTRENNSFNNMKWKTKIVTRNDWDKDLYETGDTKNSTIDERSLVLLNKRIRTKMMFGMKRPLPYAKLILQNYLINTELLMEGETKKYSNHLIDKQIFNKEYSTKYHKVQRDRIYFNLKQKQDGNKTNLRIDGYVPENELLKKPIITDVTSEYKNLIKIDEQLCKAKIMKSIPTVPTV